MGGTYSSSLNRPVRTRMLWWFGERARKRNYVGVSKLRNYVGVITTLGSYPVNCFREAMPHEILAEQAATVMVSTNRYRRSPPHVSTRFIAPSETFVHWLNAIRVINGALSDERSASVLEQWAYWIKNSSEHTVEELQELLPGLEFLRATGELNAIREITEP
jgi:hypothetical protein